MTHRRIHRAAGLALALLAPLAGQAADGGDRWQPQLALHLEQLQLDTWPARVDFGNGIARDGALELGRGRGGGLQLALQRGRLRLELEAQQGRLALEGVALGAQASAAAGRVRYRAFTLNAAWQQPLDARWSAELMLGAGRGRVELPQAALAGGGCQCFAASEGRGTVVQARLALAWKSNDAQQPFVHLGALRLPAAQGQATGGPAVRYARRSVVQAGVGWRAAF